VRGVFARIQQTLPVTDSERHRDRRRVQPAIEMFDVDLHRMEQTSQENPHTVLKVRREGPEVKPKPSEKEKPVKSPRKPTSETKGFPLACDCVATAAAVSLTRPPPCSCISMRCRSRVPGRAAGDLRNSEAPLFAKGGREDDDSDDDDNGHAEEVFLTRRKGKEKLPATTTRTPKKRTSSAGGNDDCSRDQELDTAAPACPFPEWTQRDIDEELFFYPDDIAYTVRAPDRPSLVAVCLVVWADQLISCRRSRSCAPDRTPTAS
jgi:hypothetical protein